MVYLILGKTYGSFLCLLHKLHIPENKVVTKIFGPKKAKAIYYGIDDIT
jgi:hypothetical protein